MSTPEISNGKSAKLSPFGSGISKSLLTPCRRVGLSRKRKSSTPNSIAKILSGDATVSDSSFTEAPDSTPLNHKKPLPIRKSVGSVNRPALKAVNDDTSTHNEETSCKKKLLKSFSADQLNKEATKSNTVEPITIKALIHNTSEGTLANPILDSGEKENISEVAMLAKVTSNSLSIEHRELETRMEVSEEITKLKIYEDSESKSNKKLVREISVDSNQSSKECKVTLTKLNKEQIEATKNINVKKILSCNSDDSIVKQKERNFSMIDDENDFFTSSPKYCSPNRNVDTTKKKEIKLEKKKSSELKRKHSIHLLDIDDDLDAFTSTPESENEKKDLIGKLKSLECQVKVKKKKLEDLKQAAVYRKKHNVEELEALTETWRSGCISGLKGLLTQLQTHGPMDMPTLLSKLSISSEAYNKLFLGKHNN